MHYFILTAICFIFVFHVPGGASELPACPEYVKKDVWKRVAPFLLPEDHPVKPALDNIFSSSRVTLSVKTMQKAGFQNPIPRKWTHLVVTKHPKVPGYIFKIYLDAQRYFGGKKEYDFWIMRIEGRNAVLNEIEKNGFQETFKTPKKWIYLLPELPAPPGEFLRKDFILVEEDMEIFEKKENEALWTSSLVTEEKLLQLYTILENLGLHDCAKPDNAPFSRDGKIAFIDTQTLYYWPVSYKKMTPFLSKELQPYWNQLVKGSRKKSAAALPPYIETQKKCHTGH